MKRVRVAGAAALALALAAAFGVQARFAADLARARERAAQGSRVIDTRCGPIEVQEAGQGTPLLMIHGSGGGHDQGMAWARPLAQHGVRVIAMSRFGYLRTPRPDDASPQAQADAHACLLDALGIAKAAVMGVSAGGPSALQTAIRHPQRVRALVLVVPIAYKPGTVADSAPPVSDDQDALLLRVLGSDFLFWAGLQVARDSLIRHVLATPPEQVAAASEAERARVNDLAERILPVSARAAGLRDDTRLGKGLGPMRWKPSARRRSSSARATTASAPTPRRSTPPAASPARSSSASTTVGICSSGTTLRFRPRSRRCSATSQGREHEGPGRAAARQRTHVLCRAITS